MTVLLVIGGIIVLLLVIGLVSGNDISIERSVVINKPASEVFDYIRYLKNHENFNIWMMMDPDMKKEYRGTDGQEGFVYAWDSTKQRNVGAGEQEIKKIVHGQSVEYQLRFFRPMNDVATAKLVVTAAGAGQAQVQWGFYNTMKFPMNLMKPVMKSMLGNSLQQGVDNLKAVMEK